MSKIKKTRHATYLINYHMVWIPKYRRKILVGEIAEETKKILQAIAEEKGWEILALEVMLDHIHLFASAPPKYAPADIVKVFKGWSARHLLKQFPDLAKKAGRGTLWAPSYYVGTTGAVSSEVVRRYIEECQDR
ncbi:MAG TPA: IS200/IS605 family transposase [Syntrophorhabdus sp.]|nr:IS200/IS605 family transposase [Syntrophorhabdus sp.]